MRTALTAAGLLLAFALCGGAASAPVSDGQACRLTGQLAEAVAAARLEGRSAPNILSHLSGGTRLERELLEEIVRQVYRPAYPPDPRVHGQATRRKCLRGPN